MTTKDELKKAGVMVLPPVAPEQPESTLLIDRLATLGFTFRLNLCGGVVEVNGHPLDDIIAAEVRVALRDMGLHKKLKAAEDAYLALAKKNAYHPVREYLDALIWDGADHITQFTSCLHSSDPPIVYAGGVKAPLHHVYMYRWLIGAVAKVYTGAQNPMMVWDGPQGCGKSTAVRWLCPLPDYFIEGAINVSDKDSLVRLASKWIWEVSELDATTRKADQSALKDFITKQVVTVRRSFARYDFHGPASASLLGTLNNTSGFLADESGSRRFMVTRLDAIDLKYQQIDKDQLWAQAVMLYHSGEQWQLQGEESIAQAAQNEGYEVSTTLTDWLDRSFYFEPTYEDQYSLADIIAAMEGDGFRISGSERSQAMELARVLTQKHCKVIHTRSGNRWTGLQRRPVNTS
jgi:predicted P-loop ATPase